MGSQDISVILMSRLRAGGSEFDPRQVKVSFLLATESTPFLGPT
jgi:hypothetical protein